MIIGIDIDDTIAKTNISLLEEAFQYDKDHCGGRGFKNKEAYALKDMFYWSDEDVLNFMTFIRDGNLFTEISPIKDSALYVNKLFEEGHKIYFITRRKNTANMLKVTMKWLDKHGFKYHKLLMGCSEKGNVCEEERVNLFIDNDVKHVTEVACKGIKVLLMSDCYNTDCTVFTRVDTWEDVYEYVHR